MTGINNLRQFINEDRIIVHPRCVTTIHHLKTAKWKNASKDDLGRGVDNSHHFDAIPALSYLLRAIDLQSNPYPKDYKNPLKKESSFNYAATKGVDNEGVYKKILNLNNQNISQSRKNEEIVKSFNIDLKQNIKRYS